MPVFLALFGLGIALFQTFILTGLYNFNLKPKWIVFLVTPLSILISSCIDENAGLMVLLAHFTSVFLFGIIGIIIQSFRSETGEKNNKEKPKATVQPNIPQSFLFNPMFGVMYQIYVIIIILLHIFIPKTQNLNTEDLMNSFYKQIYFQFFSIAFLLGFSITYFLSIKTYNFKQELINEKISNKTLKLFFSNKVIPIYIVIIAIMVFNYFFDIRRNIPMIIEEISKPSIYNLTIGFLAYLFYQIILIIINPKVAVFLNLIKAKTFFKSAFYGIFMGAAFIPIFIVLDSQLEYFNMSSEIVLFLGFNIVLLITEIIIYRKKKNSTFTESIL